MTPKEALIQFEWLADKLAYWSGHDISELDEQYNYSGLLGQVYQSINELEELKRDVKRYFELRNEIFVHENEDEMEEYEMLSGKLWKVGKEI